MIKRIIIICKISNIWRRPGIDNTGRYITKVSACISCYYIFSNLIF